MGCGSQGIARWSAPMGVLRFPIAVDFIEKVRVTYAQGEGDDGKPNILFEKTEADCEFVGNEVRFSITQEETLMLDADELVEVQVQGYDKKGVPFVSDIVRLPVNEVINEGVSW